MGGTGSSSKRKAPKKKSKETSSQRSKSQLKESKKRSRDYDSISSDSDDPTRSSTSELRYSKRKNKSKKHRRDLTISSNSDARSIDSVSDSLSSHKNKKKRLLRLASRSSKKRHRNRSSSPYRKRKRSGRDRVNKTKKKLKKSKKYLSSSSRSGSPSCSTSQRSGSSIQDGGRRKSKINSNKDRERTRGRDSYKAHKKRKHRSPSSSCSRESYGDYERHEVRSQSRSSCSRCSEQIFSVRHSDDSLFPVSSDALVPVENSKRLKSVIAIDYEPYNGGNGQEIYLSNGEIAYNRDDYPCPKSPEGNEKGSKREFDIFTRDADNKRICVEKVEHEKGTERDNGLIDGIDNLPDGALANNSKEKKMTDASVSVSILNGDDLESILRRKALENLRKFKGSHQTGQRNMAHLKITKGCVVGETSTGSADTNENKSSRQESSNNHDMDQGNGPMLNSDSPLPLGKTNYQEKDENVDQESDIAKQDVIHPRHGALLLKLPEEERSTSSISVSGNPPLMSDCHLNPGTANAFNSSAEEPIPNDGKHNLEAHQNESKDGSQFEQKTMSVMRGGEMVQVSYKVYIPKRAPALSRRPLRR